MLRTIPVPKHRASTVLPYHQACLRTSVRAPASTKPHCQFFLFSQQLTTSKHPCNIITNRNYQFVFSANATTVIPSQQIQSRSQPKALSTELMEMLSSLTDSDELDNMMAKLMKISSSLNGGKKWATYVLELNDRIKIPLSWTLMESVLDTFIELNKPHLAVKFWKNYKLSLPLPPRFNILAKVLAACSASKDFQELENTFTTLRQHNLLNAENVTVLCQIFGKLEDLRVLSHLLKEIRHYRIPLSAGSIVELIDKNMLRLQTALENQDFAAMSEIFDSMKNILYKNQLRKALKWMLQSPLEDPWELYKLVERAGGFYEMHCYMAQSFERKKDLESALKVFEMSKKQHPKLIDGIMIDAVLKCFMSAGKFPELMEWFEKICDELKFVPNPYTMEVLVKIIAQAKGPHDAVKYINEELPKRKMYITPGMYSIILNSFASIGDIFSTKVWFQKILDNFGTPTAENYAAMMSLYAERADDISVLSLYQEAIQKVTWNSDLLHQVLHCYNVMGAPEIMESYFTRELNQGKDLTFPFVEMLTYYSQRGDILNLDRLLKEAENWGIRRVSHLLCTAMDGYSKGGHVLKLHQYWDEIREKRYHLLSDVCYEILIGYSAWSNNFADIDKWLEELKQSGHKESLLTRCILLFQYSRNGDWEKAKFYIDSISNLEYQPVYVRTFMFRAYASFGKVPEMESMLEAILSSPRPPTRDDIYHILVVLGFRGDPRLMEFFFRCESSWNFRHNWATFRALLRYCKPEQLSQCVEELRIRRIKINDDLCKVILKRAVQNKDHKLVLWFWNLASCQNWKMESLLDEQCVEILQNAPTILEDSIAYQDVWATLDLPSLGERAVKFLIDLATRRKQIEAALDLVQKVIVTAAVLEPLSAHFAGREDDPLKKRFENIKKTIPGSS